MSLDDQLWKAWVEPFDVFISYARADNQAPDRMVSAFVDSLKGDFANFSPSVPLHVFFDQQSILDGQYWQSQIYRGLRQSKAMIALLSKSYFESEWCRREWDEYVRLEQARTFPGESLTPIFIVAPRDLASQIPPHLRAWWEQASQRNGVVEVADYWTRGRAALQELLVADRVQRIRETIVQRVEFGRRLERVPRNLTARNPHFTGRDAQLARLREELSRHQMAGLCAVNGVGGIGKSSVAFEYAHRFRPEYLGGQFEIKLAGVTDFRAIQSEFVRLARAYYRAEIPPTLSEEDQYRRACDCFQTLPVAEKVLMILDNVDEQATELVGVANRNRLPSAERVHYLVTTRADERLLGGLSTVSLDVLEPAEALDMLFAYRTFAFRADDPEYEAARAGTMPATYDDAPADAEWKAALAIVNKLGRHSLAVALVGAYLGTHSLDYRGFLRDMTEQGIGLTLDVVGQDVAVRNLIAHPQPLIRQLFEQSLARLTPLALRTLGYAAQLPPDSIPLDWLRTLVAQDAEMAEHLRRRPFQAEPFDEALALLAGLDYLKGAPLARMHVLLGNVVRERLSPEQQSVRRASVLAQVERRAVDVHDGRATYSSTEEFEAVLRLLDHERQASDHVLERMGLWIVPRLQEYGRLREARKRAVHASNLLRHSADADPASAQKQRDLSISFNILGGVSVASGDLDAARKYFSDDLQIAQRLADADPASAQRQRDLSVSFNKLGDVSVAAGDLDAARKYFSDSLKIAQRLADADPASAEEQRDLSISFERLGDVSVAAGELDAARKYFSDSLSIRQRLADADPASAQRQRDLSISFNKLGDVSVAAGNLKAARKYFSDALQIAQRLANADPASAQKQRDLSISFNKLGDVSVAAGDLEAARQYLSDDLQIAQRLADADPASAEKRRDLWVSEAKIADLFERENRLDEARDAWRRCLTILQGMVHCALHVSPSDLKFFERLKRKLDD